MNRFLFRVAVIPVFTVAGMFAVFEGTTSAMALTGADQPVFLSTVTNDAPVIATEPAAALTATQVPVTTAVAATPKVATPKVVAKPPAATPKVVAKPAKKIAAAPARAEIGTACVITRTSSAGC